MLRTLTNRPLLTLAALLAFGAAAAAQDPDPKAPDPEIPAKVDQLEDCVKDRKLERDAEGVTVIDTLMQKIQAGVNEKDQKEITDALGDVLNKGKVRPPQDTGLYVAAIKALAYCGEDGADILAKAYEGKRFKHHKDWVPLRVELLPAKILYEQILPEWLDMERELLAFKNGDRAMLLWSTLMSPQTRNYEQAVSVLEELLAMPGNEDLAQAYQYAGDTILTTSVRDRVVA